MGIPFVVSNLNDASENLNQFEKWLTYAFPIYRTGDFFIGCIIGWIFLNTDFLKEIGNKVRSALEFGIMVIIIASKYIYDYQIGILGSEWCRYSLLFIPSSIMVVYLFALNEGYFTRILSRRGLIFLGDISPYTFLIHQLVIRYYNIVISYMGIELGIVMKYIICLNITIFIALFWIKVCNRRIWRKKNSEKILF